MVELRSVYPTMPESAPLSSYRCGNEVRVWRHPEALSALRQMATRAGDDPSEVGLHSLRIGAAATLATGEDVSQGVIQREGRWKSSGSSKVYTRNNPEDAGIVSRKLAETGKIGQRQPGRGTVWGRTPWYRRDLGVGGCQWFATIGGLGRQRLRVLVPRPVGWWGGSPGFWQYDRRREAAAGAAGLVSRQWSPPPTSQRTIIT